MESFTVHKIPCVNNIIANERSSPIIKVNTIIAFKLYFCTNFLQKNFTALLQWDGFFFVVKKYMQQDLVSMRLQKQQCLEW